MDRVGSVLRINQFYHGGIPPTNATATPTFEQFLVQDITAKRSGGGNVICLPEWPCHDIRFERVHVEGSSFNVACVNAPPLCASRAAPDGAPWRVYAAQKRLWERHRCHATPQAHQWQPPTHQACASLAAWLGRCRRFHLGPAWLPHFPHSSDCADATARGGSGVL